MEDWMGGVGALCLHSRPLGREGNRWEAMSHKSRAPHPDGQWALRGHIGPLHPDSHRVMRHHTGAPHPDKHWMETHLALPHTPGLVAVTTVDADAVLSALILTIRLNWFANETASVSTPLLDIVVLYSLIYLQLIWIQLYVSWSSYQVLQKLLKNISSLPISLCTIQTERSQDELQGKQTVRQYQSREQTALT